MADDPEGRLRKAVYLPSECWEWLERVARRDGVARSDLLEGLVLLAMDADERSPIAAGRRGDAPLLAGEEAKFRAMARSPEYRQGMADAVVAIAVARLWPHHRPEDIAKAAGVSGQDLHVAWKRHHTPPARRVPLRVLEPKPRETPPSQPSPRPPAPPGQKWCNRGKHFVDYELMGKNRSRSDGMSDNCRFCWRLYWRERRRRRSIGK